MLEKDQFIFLEKKQKVETDYYIVQQNETMYDVAQKNGILLQSLYDYNKISATDNIYPGTKILLKPGTCNQSSASGNTGMSAGCSNQPRVTESKTHEVQPKESLYAISKKYDVTVAQLKEWNNLKDDNLKIGQQLIISK